MELRTAGGKPLATARSGQDVEFHLHFENRSERHFPELAVRLNVQTQLGAPVFMQSNHLSQQPFGRLPSSGAFVCRLPGLPLPAASYRVGFKVSPGFRNSDPIDAVQHALDLHVEKGDFFGTGESPSPQVGTVLVRADWRLDSRPLVDNGSVETPPQYAERDPAREGALGEAGPLEEKRLL